MPDVLTPSPKFHALSKNVNLVPAVSNEFETVRVNKYYIRHYFQFFLQLSLKLEIIRLCGIKLLNKRAHPQFWFKFYIWDRQARGENPNLRKNSNPENFKFYGIFGFSWDLFWNFWDFPNNLNYYYLVVARRQSVEKFVYFICWYLCPIACNFVSKSDFDQIWICGNVGYCEYREPTG